MNFTKYRFGLFFILVLVAVTLLSSCGILGAVSGMGTAERNEPISSGEADAQYNVDDDGFTNFGFGSYKEANGWIFEPKYAEMEGRTPAEKRYYIMDGVTPTQRYASNISIEVGSNRYSPEEHLRFRDGILSSLGAQTRGAEVTIGASGSNTSNGYVLYEFSIDMEDADGPDTTQYYVVGDQKYFLIIATDFHDPGVSLESIKKALDEIANSFVWNDLEPVADSEHSKQALLP
ncbi:hypothetical protein AGMMS49983_00160 [Clostridia bacterium]|nr:hypothetical protein AGMMS49983_00160 [Clostridia bacterium]